MIAAAALCVVVVAAIARAGTPVDAVPGGHVRRLDGFPSSATGVDPELICATGPGLAKRTEAAPHGVVGVRHGALVDEQYFAGDMYGYVVQQNANKMHDVASITKGVVAVVALLMGIAFDRGWLGDLDTR